MMRRGLFAGSFDPPTKGHEDIIRRARAECDHLVVAVLKNEEKMPTFTTVERAAMLRRIVSDLDGVTVLESADLLVDVILREDIQILFRGIRDEKDQAYEDRQLGYHKLILASNRFPKVHFLTARPDLRDVSSSLVKSFVSLDVDVSWMVHRFVKARLHMSLKDQIFLGLTGQMGTGKTHVAQCLVRDFNARNLSASYLNLDAVVRDLYEEQSAGAQAVRDALARHFGERVLTNNRTGVDRLVLKTEVAKIANKAALTYLHNLTAPHVDRLIRQFVRGKKGLIIVEWAQLCENEMDYLVDGNAVVVESPDQQEFLQTRGATDFFKAVGSAQWSADQKIHYLQNAAQKHGHGQVWRHVNRCGESAQDLCEQIHSWAQTSFLNMHCGRV